MPSPASSCLLQATAVIERIVRDEKQSGAHADDLCCASRKRTDSLVALSGHQISGAMIGDVEQTRCDLRRPDFSHIKIASVSGFCCCGRLPGCRCGGLPHIPRACCPGRQHPGRYALANVTLGPAACHHHGCIKQQCTHCAGGVHKVGAQATSYGASEDIIDGQIGQDVQVCCFGCCDAQTGYYKWSLPL